MPKCRNCQKTISSRDRDICPYCGIANPIEEGYKTQDITQFIDPVTGEYKLYESKKRSLAVLFSCLLGPFGVAFFYLERKLWAVLSIVLTLILVGVGVVLALFVHPLLVLIPIILDYIIHIVYGIYLASSHAAKDGNGEFLR